MLRIFKSGNFFLAHPVQFYGCGDGSSCCHCCSFGCGPVVQHYRLYVSPTYKMKPALAFISKNCLSDSFHGFIFNFSLVVCSLNLVEMWRALSCFCKYDSARKQSQGNILYTNCENESFSRPLLLLPWIEKCCLRREGLRHEVNSSV